MHSLNTSPGGHKHGQVIKDDSDAAVCDDADDVGDDQDERSGGYERISSNRSITKKQVVAEVLGHRLLCFHPLDLLWPL